MFVVDVIIIVLKILKETLFHRLSYSPIDSNSSFLSSVRLPRRARNDRVESEIVFALWIAADTGLWLMPV